MYVSINQSDSQFTVSFKKRKDYVFHRQVNENAVFLGILRNAVNVMRNTEDCSKLNVKCSVILGCSDTFPVIHAGDNDP